MIEFSLINQVLVLSTSAIGIWLAFWVYFADRTSKINKFFFLFTIAMVLYITFSFLSHHPTYFSLTLLWKKLLYASIALFIIFTYFFSVYFPKESKRHPLLDKIIAVTEIFFFLLILFTSLIVKDATIEEWGTDVIWGPAKNIWFANLFILTILIASQIIKKYFKLSKKEKIQTQYFLMGVIIFAVMNLIFNVFIPVFKNTYKYYAIGNLSTIFLLGFTTYAIVVRGLFGIKVILTALFVALIGVLLGLDVAIFTSETTIRLFKLLILVFFLYFGYLLIKSVINEIKRRTTLEKLSSKLQITHIRLEASYKGMQELARSLEEKVKERTKELRQRIDELEKFHKTTVGRELEMIELKKEIKRLNKELEDRPEE